MEDITPHADSPALSGNAVAVAASAKQQDSRQPVDPAFGDPLRQDNDKVRMLGSFVRSLCVLE